MQHIQANTTAHIQAHSQHMNFVHFVVRTFQDFDYFLHERFWLFYDLLLSCALPLLYLYAVLFFKLRSWFLDFEERRGVYVTIGFCL